MFIKFKKSKIFTMEPQKEDSKIANKPSPDLILMYAYLRAVKDIIYTTKPDQKKIVANGYINTEKWFSEIYFDGTAFFCKKCKSIITTPPCPEVGILFEIGRILTENKLSMVTIKIPNT